MDFTKTILKGVKAWANSNFVNYNEQTLTDNQKAQVRENIGLVDPSGSFQELVTNEAGEQIWEERTHYEYIAEIVPETSYSAADIREDLDFLPIYTPFEIIEGQEYIVIYNNIEYKTTGQKHAQEGVSGYYIGNAGFLTEEIENNNLPFLFMVPSDANLFPENIHGAFLPIDQFAGVDTSKIKGTYSIKGPIAKKLDPKFYNTPDWNAQEGEDGYIKNKTHGLGEYIEYLPETEIDLTFMTGDGVSAAIGEFPVSMSTLEPLINLKACTFTYDGVDYNCELYVDFNEGVAGAGNFSSIGLPFTPSSNVPFIMAVNVSDQNDDGTILVHFYALDKTEDTTITLKVSNNGYRTIKLDKKYLPDNIFYIEGEGPTMIMEPLNSTGSGTFTASAPLEENKKYIVTISGEEFNVKCHKLSQNENLYLYLGNASLAFESTDTKEDFLIFTSSNNPTNFNYIFRDFPYNSEFFIESAGSYSKIPSQHLPTPNWNARKGEEGYIENRTHYHIPGFTAHWDGATEGKATANIDNITLYKISDNFLSIDRGKFYDLVGIQTEDGTIYKGWPFYYNNNNIMFQALSDNVNSFFFSCADAGEGTLFNPNNPSAPSMQYFAQESGLYIGSISGLSSSTLDVIVLDETKQLDSIFIPDDFLYIKNGPNNSLETSWRSQSSDKTPGIYSMALGHNSSSEGAFSVALGQATSAKGDYAVALGQVTSAEGIYSFASGKDTRAKGEASFTNGTMTCAIGKGAHAEGLGQRLTCHLTSEGDYLYTHDIPSDYDLQSLVGCVVLYNDRSTYISRITDTHLGTWTASLSSDPLDNALVSIYSAASGYQSHTEGRYTNTIGAASHAEGECTVATSHEQHVQGRYNDTLGGSGCAHVVGNGTAEARSNAHTLDWDGTAWYAGDVYVGGTRQSDAAAKKLATEEYVDNAVANGGISTEGLATEEYVNNAIANLVDSSPETLNTLNELSAALGDDPNFATTVANQIAEKANKSEVATNIMNGSTIGSLRTVGVPVENELGNYAFAEGQDTIASGYGSHTEGSGSIASGENSHAEGRDTLASGGNSHAEGLKATASGHNSHAEGQHTLAIGQSSHAEGIYTVADGPYSHAEGKGASLTAQVTGEANATTYTVTTENIQIGDYISLNEIRGNEKIKIIAVNGSQITLERTLSESALSSKSVRIYRKSASGYASHTEGEDTIASGNCSHAEGYCTTASGQYQHVQGRYNLSDSDNYAHIVGNGTDSSRSNAHTLNWDGTAWFANDVYVGGTGQFDETTEKLVRKSELEEALTGVEVDEITSDEINAICGATIQLAEEVTY